jgi:hypothetical protein
MIYFVIKKVVQTQLIVLDISTNILHKTNDQIQLKK